MWTPSFPITDNPTSKAVTGQFGMTGLTNFVVKDKPGCFTRQLDGRTQISGRWRLVGTNPRPMSALAILL
jgi:hypothetical protein